MNSIVLQTTTLCLVKGREGMENRLLLLKRKKLPKIPPLAESRPNSIATISKSNSNAVFLSVFIQMVLKSISGKFFFVPKEEIIEENYDLSFSKYKEDLFEEVVYEKPAVIFGKIKAMEKEIDKELKELEGMLK